MIYAASPHAVVYLAVMAAVFAYLYWTHRQSHFLLWALAWGSLLIEQFHDSLVSDAAGTVDIVLVASAAALVIVGGVVLAGRRRLGLLGGAAFGAGLGALTALGHLAIAAVEPGLSRGYTATLAFLAAGWIGTGWLIARFGGSSARIGSRIAGLSLATWGVIQPVGWILVNRGLGEAWLVQFDAALGALLAVGMVILGIEESRVRVTSDLAYSREVLDDDPNLIVVLQDGRFVFANRALMERTGRSMENVGGYDPLDLVAPEDRERAARALADRMAGTPVPDYEMRVLGADGERIPVIVHADPIHWAGERAFKYELIDVSTRVLAEEETRVVNEELQRINAELERSNELKTEFLSNTSHELKTPLTSIIANTEILEYEMCGPLNDEQRQVLANIGRNSQHLLEMISRLLDFARREEGHDVLQYEKVEVRTLVDGVVRTVRPLLDDKSITIEVEIPDDLGPCWMDGEKVYRIFLNLVENAIKFSNEGTIRVGARRVDDELEGLVADEGIGIPPELAADIFHAFRQVDASATRPYEGVGLGLAICKQLVELHDGRIWVESRAGEGSAFHFRIPWRDRSPEGTGSSEEPAPPPGDESPEGRVPAPE